MTTRLQLGKQTYHETPPKGRRKNTKPPKCSHGEVASKTKKKKHKSLTPSPAQSDLEGNEKCLAVEEMEVSEEEVRIPLKVKAPVGRPWKRPSL